ncbi:MAG: hypothetical protein HYX69_13730 [Planctomycetia bacterium]|nr:hypothetical protein [Planctomycetia bacterium]
MEAETSANKQLPVDVFCPAVTQDDYDEEYADVPTSIKPVALIVVGTLDEETMALKVERTLFGPRISEIQLAPVRPEIKEVKYGEPRIFCLSLAGSRRRTKPRSERVSTEASRPDLQFALSEYFERYRVFPLEDEPILTAMAQARLDLLVLGSSMIFVGRPVEAAGQANNDSAGAPPSKRLPVAIAVERVLHGPDAVAGKTVNVSGALDPYASSTGSYIYFVREMKNTDGQNVYQVQRRWPDSEVALVDKTLKRRALFPVRDGRQEVLFSGTVRAAITLIDTHFDPGQKLVARRLIADSEVALPEVTAFVEAHLFSKEADGLASYDQQMYLVRVLGRIEQHRTDGEVARLINLMLDKIQAGATFPRDADREHAARRPQAYADSNNSLQWLLQTLDERDAARIFGARLLQVRPLGAYGWAAEIWACLHSCHFEEHMELAQAIERMAKIVPVTFSASARKRDAQPRGHSEPISRVAFVGDGTRLQTFSADGVTCYWDPRTGASIDRVVEPINRKSRKAAIEASETKTVNGRKLGDGETAFLSEDRQHWYIFKATDAHGKYPRPSAFSIEVSDVASREATDGRDDIAEAGDPWRSLGKIPVTWGEHRPFGLVPDGKSIYFETRIFRRDNLQPVSRAKAAGDISDIRFFADGSRYVLKTSDRDRERDRWALGSQGVTKGKEKLSHIRIHDAKTGRTLLAVELPQHTRCPAAVSEDGRLLAIVEGKNAVKIWPIPAE